MNLAALAARLTLYERLMRLDKPIGTLLLLWPTLWALWLAGNGRPQGWIVWIFALGTLLMRSAGCVMNDLADWRYDARVERTRSLDSRLGTDARLLRAGAVAQPAYGTSLICRARPCGDLSPDQAISCDSAGLSRNRVRLRHSD